MKTKSKSCSSVFRVVLFVFIVLSSVGCGKGVSSTNDDHGELTPATSNRWDEMKWDEGKWN